MSIAQNETVVHRFFEEAFNQGRVEVLDELFAPNYIVHLNSDVILEGEGAKRAITSVRAMLPDLHYTVEEQIVNEDRVAARFAYSATFLGESDTFPATAKGKRFTARGLILFHLVDGKVVEGWMSTDRLHQFRQLDLKLTPVPSA